MHPCAARENSSSGRRNSSESAESCSSSSPAERLDRVFRHFDENGDGKVSPSEIYLRMKIVGLEMSMEEAIDAVDSADLDRDGLLGFAEFAALMGEDEEAQKEEDREREMREAFGVYEMKGSGYITAASLMTVLGRVGNCSGIEDCKAMIRRYDLDGDGVIDFEEFKAMLAH